MPYSRKFVKRYRKSNTSRKGRRFFRSYGKSYSASSVNSRYNRKYNRTKVKIPTRVLPDYTLVKLKATTTLATAAGTTPAIGTYSYVQFQLNGNDIFDPFNAFTVDQPNGFDQWMAFYANFIVHKSSIRVTPLYWDTDPVVDGGPILPFQLTIVPMQTQTGPIPNPLTTEYSELPYSKSRIYTGGLPISTGTTPSVQYSGNAGQVGFVSLTNSMMTKKILGYKDLSDVDGVRGTGSASPAERFAYVITVKSMMPGAGATLTNYRLSPLGLRVDMYFKCQLLNRLNVSDSSV